MIADAVGDPDAVTVVVAVGLLMVEVAALQRFYEANTPASTAPMMAARSAIKRHTVHVLRPNKRLGFGILLCSWTAGINAFLSLGQPL